MEQLIKDTIICPITNQIFFDPVVASDGHIYEFSQISLYLQKNNLSPITREPITKDLCKIYTMRNIIDNYLEMYPEEKDNQYKPSFSYSDNISTIKKFVKNKEYNKLLSYTNFDLKSVLEITANFPENIYKYIIDNCIDLECESDSTWRPIHYICRYSTPEMIKYIINKNVNLEVETENKWRPIHCICRYSTPKIIKYIIDKNVNLEAETEDKWRPIHFICRFSTPKMIKYIIDKNVDLGAREDIFGWRSIHIICKYSNLKIIKYILNRNVDLEVENNKKWRPIHYACRYSNPKMIKYIIDKNVNLESANNKKKGPIYYACRYSSFEIVNYFLDKKIIIPDNIFFAIDKNNKMNSIEKTIIKNHSIIN